MAQVQLSVQNKFQGRYDVYDSDTYSPARYFLLRRGSNTTSAAAVADVAANTTLNSTTVAAPSAAATNASELLLGNSTRRLLATAVGNSRLTGVTTSGLGGLRFSTSTSVLGGSGLTGNDGTGSHWTLPADPSQLADAGAMFSRVDAMYDNIVLYGLLQVGSKIALRRWHGCCMRIRAVACGCVRGCGPLGGLGAACSQQALRYFKLLP